MYLKLRLGGHAMEDHIYLTTAKVLVNGNCTKYWVPSWRAYCPVTDCNLANDSFNYADEHSKETEVKGRRGTVAQERNLMLTQD